jgi:transposase
MTMRKIREILRLRLSLGRSHREIAQACNISTSTVGDCLVRFRVSGLPWPLSPELDDVALEKKLYRLEPSPSADRPGPNWDWVMREMRKKHVTLSLLWQEYHVANPDGYEYSWFCESYATWKGRQDLVMRQNHKLGEKCFVDYAGDTISVVTPETGEIRKAFLFVGALGGSNYTYAEATWSQELPLWVASHVRMFAFFGGVPEILIPDNLKSGVTKANYYEPDINLTYQEMAEHYGVAVLPARVRKPRDKAKVENAVLLAERWILATLRNLTFFSLEELNKAISELLAVLNDRLFQKLPGSRRQIFEQEEKPLLRPLPKVPYVFGQWKKARVNIDYHIDVEGHHYSVPYSLAREAVEIRMTGTIVEIFHAGLRVASHPRSYRRGGTTTVNEHMPPRHRNMAEWTPERITTRAASIGSTVATMASRIMESRQHPEQGFRACLGLLRLSSQYGKERLEAACCRALSVGACSYKSVHSILKNSLDRQLSFPLSLRSAGHHENVRGSEYYRQEGGELT